MTWARSSKRELDPVRPLGCPVRPWGPQPPACPGLGSSTTVPLRSFGVPVPGWDGQGTFWGDCPLIKPPHWWARVGVDCQLQGGQRGFSGSSPVPPSFPKTCGDCSNFTCSWLPREAGGLCSGKGKGRCHRGAGGVGVWGSGALMLPLALIAKLGGLL